MKSRTGNALVLWGVASALVLGVALAPAGALLRNQAPSEAAAPLVAVLRGPGEIGYWLVQSDGTVEVVGTSVVPQFEETDYATGQVVGARTGAPGALGIWLRLADGSEVAVGDPGPNIDRSDHRPTGWLVGVGTRQLLSGAWWPDIDLACTADLPLRVRVGQTLMASLGEFGFASTVIHARTHRLGGVLLEGSATPHIWRRIEELQEFGGHVPLLFAVDEEGGRVQRLRGVLPTLDSAASQTSKTVAEVSQQARQHALEMSGLGFNVNFAPVLDVGSAPGIGDRSFGNDPGLVTEYGVATATGLAAGGVLPVVKHFPGHGSADADTHQQLATTPPLEQLRARDLTPFTAAIGSENVAVMVGHLNVPNLTDGLPASLSPAAIGDLLRTELGHSGLVVTDSLSMEAITSRWSVSQAAVLALIAGADLLLVSGLDQVDASAAAIAAALSDGRLSEETLNRAATNVLRAKGVYACELVGRVD